MPASKSVCQSYSVTCQGPGVAVLATASTASICWAIQPCRSATGLLLPAKVTDRVHQHGRAEPLLRQTHLRTRVRPIPLQIERAHRIRATPFRVGLVADGPAGHEAAGVPAVGVAFLPHLPGGGGDFVGDVLPGGELLGR